MGSILNDKNILFHGIGNNIFGFIGIMKYGICSNLKSIQLGNPYFCINTVGSNGYNYICTSVSPSINGIDTSDTYNTYIKNGISFVIQLQNDMQIKTNDVTSYNDVCYIRDYIPKEAIIGIMLSKEMLNKSISELSLGLNKKYLTYSSVVPKKCRHIAKCMELECNYKIDSETLNDLLKSCDYESIESFMCLSIDNAFKHKFNNNVTLYDIINFYNDDKFKLYDEFGMEITMQNVTKK